MPGGSHGAAGAPVSNRRDGWPSRDAGWTPALRPAVIGHWSLVILSSLVIGHWSFAQSNLPPATVSFLDGSFLRGGIGSLNSDTLRWLHPNARAPIEFSTTNLNLIRLPTRSTNLPTNAGPVCRVVLASGDEFEGQLLSLDADSFEIETWFAGKLRGQRAGLASLAFYGSSQSALYDGPRAAEEWKVSTGSATVNRVGVNVFGGGNVFIRPAVPVAPQPLPAPVRPAVPEFRLVEPDAKAAVKTDPTPQELVRQLKAEIASLGEKVSPVVKQALGKRLKEAEEAAAKAPVRASTSTDIMRMVGFAQKAATVEEFLATDLVRAATDAGQTSRRILERWFADYDNAAELAKDKAKEARFKVRVSAEAALLGTRLLRAFGPGGLGEAEALILDQMRAQLANGAVAPDAEPRAGVEARVRVPAVPAVRKIFTEVEVTKLTDAAEKAATVADFLKSELVTTALAEKQTSRATLDRWFAEFEQPVAWQGDAVKTARFKAMVRAEADLLGRRLQGRAAAFVELPPEVAEAQARGNAAANALADARVRALDALRLNNPNLAVAIGAEGALAGRAAVAGAANPNAAWQFRDGAYYSAGVGTLGRECQLPTKTRIEFDLAWKGQPYFRFSFFTRSTEHYDYSDGWQFYTSSSGYIYSMRRSGMGATSSSGARVPQMLAKNTVRFTFLVNTEAETVVLLADGEKVHEWKGLGSPGPGTGIVFYNYNSNSRVRLSDIRVAPWDGRERDAVEPLGAPGTDPDKLVEVPPADSAVVEFANRDRATGTLHGIRDGRLSFNPAGTKLEIPLARAALIAFPVGDAPALPKVEGVQVTLHRNERLTLALEKWEAAEIIAVSPVFGRLKLKPEAVRALRFNPSATRGPVDEWSGP